eukprot:8312776-Prorocentrum_lima.AAC.1
MHDTLIATSVRIIHVRSGEPEALLMSWTTYHRDLKVWDTLETMSQASNPLTGHKSKTSGIHSCT